MYNCFPINYIIIRKLINIYYIKVHLNNNTMYVNQSSFYKLKLWNIVLKYVQIIIFLNKYFIFKNIYN